MNIMHGKIIPVIYYFSCPPLYVWSPTLSIDGFATFKSNDYLFNCRFALVALVIGFYSKKQNITTADRDIQLHCQTQWNILQMDKAVPVCKTDWEESVPLRLCPNRPPSPHFIVSLSIKGLQKDSYKRKWKCVQTLYLTWCITFDKAPVTEISRTGGNKPVVIQTLGNPNCGKHINSHQCDRRQIWDWLDEKLRTPLHFHWDKMHLSGIGLCSTFMFLKLSLLDSSTLLPLSTWEWPENTCKPAGFTCNQQ